MKKPVKFLNIPAFDAIHVAKKHRLQHQFTRLPELISVRYRSFQPNAKKERARQHALD